EAGTGLMLQLSPEKRHIVRLSRPGYQPWYTTVVLRPGEGKNIAAELYPEPEAFVEVTLGQVDFARFVRVDEAGEARPLPTTLRLSVGRHVLSYLDAEGNPMWRTVQVFDPSGPREFTPRVELQFAEVAVVVENAAEVGYAYVFIDGQEWKSGTTSATPMRTLVPAGQHRVRLVRDGFRAVPTDTTVLLAPGERVRLGFKLFPAR
ncbi:MAG: PEGA domain-containing protein, partial [candidate division KSB1 bacterium]|nr:PEGA domain-containing protein [candidate division KSB1 bacterium]